MILRGLNYEIVPFLGKHVHNLLFYEPELKSRYGTLRLCWGKNPAGNFHCMCRENLIMECDAFAAKATYS